MAYETLYWAMVFLTGSYLKSLMDHPELVCFVHIVLSREELRVFSSIQVPPSHSSRWP